MPTSLPIWAAIETQFHHLVRTLPRLRPGRRERRRRRVIERVLARGCWTPVERFNVAAGWYMERCSDGDWQPCISSGKPT
jgi:UDP-N-acetylmuramate: L-alanyl-gamma-D-glutamyl-meso-diaminopimelate ligase